MDIQKVKRKILQCIMNIYDNDSDLLTRDNYEVTISAKLSQYLYMAFREYDVDCEYNKHIDSKKCLNTNEIRPDIIIHKRGNDENNLVYIEIKKQTNTESRDNDISKLEENTNDQGQYKYRLGVFIDFSSEKTETKIKYFEHGEKITEFSVSNVFESLDQYC